MGTVICSVTVASSYRKMCFDQKSSFGFAALGFYLAYYVHSRTMNTRLAVGVFWFFLMELLQGFQYFWINECSHPMNQFLTLLGFFHICYQPYFTHVINSSLTKNPKFIDQYNIILRLCLLGGTMLFSRYFLAKFSAAPVSSDLSDWKNSSVPAGACRTQEWLRGEELCTYKGKYHLSWSVPMYDVTYFSPGAAIHSFLMFSPFFVMKSNMIIQGVILWASGPYLASWISPNLQEQASIWCFFSIMQIGVMLLLVREHLLLSWGRKTTSIHSVHTDDGKPTTPATPTTPRAKSAATKSTPAKSTPAKATPAAKGKAASAKKTK